MLTLLAFCSISKQSTGTRVAQALGTDKAREFLAHDVNSSTFETSYNQGIVALDAMGIAMGREMLSTDILLEGTLYFELT